MNTIKKASNFKLPEFNLKTSIQNIADNVIDVVDSLGDNINEEIEVIAEGVDNLDDKIKDVGEEICDGIASTIEKFTNESDNDNNSVENIYCDTNNFNLYDNIIKEYEYFENSNISDRYVGDDYQCYVKRDANGNIVEIQNYGGYAISFDENGNIIDAINIDNDVLAAFDKDGNVSYKRYNFETHEISDISIFDDENISSKQYGADQSDFRDNFDSLIHDTYIWNEMQKYYPVTSFDSFDDAMDFYERYFANITHHGCGYASAANVVFKEYEGREDEFYEKFGYPMYTVDENGNIDYNYEYFMLEYFNYDWAGKYTIEQMEKGKNYDNLFTYYFSDGVTTACDISTLDNFLLDTYNINISFKEENDKKNYTTTSDEFENESKNYFNNNDSLVIGAYGYDLYNMDDTIYKQEGGAHSMTVTGFTEDGKVVVSSWGKKFVVDNDSDLSYNSDNFTRWFNFNF